MYQADICHTLYLHNVIFQMHSQPSISAGSASPDMKSQLYFVILNKGLEDPRILVSDPLWLPRDNCISMKKKNKQKKKKTKQKVNKYMFLIQKSKRTMNLLSFPCELLFLT